MHQGVNRQLFVSPSRSADNDVKSDLSGVRVPSAIPENDASTAARQKSAEAKQSTRPTDAPFAKDSRIAIVGAGPAGLTMAYELQKKGYTRVDVYEKASRVGGMTYTKWDTAPLVDHNVAKTCQIKVVPHEMGACYLTAIRHRHILDIMDEMYLETVPMPSMEVYSGKPGDEPMHFEDWMQTTYQGVVAKMNKWPGLTTEDKAELFLRQLNKYFEERKRLLGDDENFLFPRQRPDSEALKELGMPFKDWLEHHGLKLIMPLFYETQTSQGYGYIQEVPTYYALIWNSKELFSYISLQKMDFFNLANSKLKEYMEQLSLPRRVEHQVMTETPTPKEEQQEGEGAADLQRLQKSFRAQMVQGGFMTIWERLVKKLPNVHKDVTILKVDRRGDKPAKRIQITYTIGDNADAVTAQHDYLMLACKLDDMEDWLDIQDDEKAIFDDILNYELTTTLVRIPANPGNTIPTTPHMFLPGKLLDIKDVNRCYVTRTSLKCVSPGLSYGEGDAGAVGDRPAWAPNDDTRVCFQYSGIDSVPKEDRKSNDELYKQLEADLKEYGAQAVKPHMQDDGTMLQERWKYMPHFKGAKLGHLWDLWELQNTHRTFYLGSVTCFESTADVQSYNRQLVDYYQL
ncbi:hypothetical protein ABBQ38_002876 [Trebouxia sp. C0009 RCD-2024]